MTHHKASGQARVRLGGRDVYLGKWGSPQAAAEYARVLAEWSAAGTSAPSRQGLTITDLVVAFDHFCEGEVDAGRLSRGYWESAIKSSLRRLRAIYGHTPAAEFSAARLATVRDAAQREAWVSDIDAGAAMGVPVEVIRERLSSDDGKAFKGVRRVPGPHGSAWFVLPLEAVHALAGSLGVQVRADVRVRRLAPGYINAKVIGIIRRAFRWAAEPGREMVTEDVAARLRLLPPLSGGRRKRRPVTNDAIERTLPLLPPVVADMVTIQRLTGARPGEVCRMTWAEIDRTQDPWVYLPAKHKTAHHGQTRAIVLPAPVQAILIKYLSRSIGGPIFTPRECADRQRIAMRASRRSKVTPSQEARDARRAAKPRRKYLERYTTGAYAAAVRRACLRAGLPVWSPNQLRHARATEVAARHGIDVARAVLGHARTDTTHNYLADSLDLELQRRAAAG